MRRRESEEGLERRGRQGRGGCQGEVPGQQSYSQMNKGPEHPVGLGELTDPSQKLQEGIPGPLIAHWVPGPRPKAPPHPA